jgi:nitrogen regulatory protein P-II 1
LRGARESLPRLDSVRPASYIREQTFAAEGGRLGYGASGIKSRGSLHFWVDDRRSDMTKVEAVVTRERVETVIDAVEAETGHVGVTVIEAVGHGRQRGITHEYRGRVFESRFLPKALLTFVVEDRLARAVVDAIADSARSGHESGDGIVWTTPVENVMHNRTGLALGEVEVA